MKPTSNPTHLSQTLSTQDLDQVVGGTPTGKRRHKPFTMQPPVDQQQAAGKEEHYFTIPLINATVS